MEQRQRGVAPGRAPEDISRLPAAPSVVFDVFRLDWRHARLWRGQEVVPLHPKTLAVLCCLVAQAGQLVTKDALFEAVWPETVVSESVIQVAIRQLRQVLGDQARTPRFIETVYGWGYRFIAPINAPTSAQGSAMMGGQHPVPLPIWGRPLHFVGRDAALAQLAQWWTTARQGTRQVGMIVGEPGIGKTALGDMFVAQVRATEDVWVGHGQCLDHYGVGEPYLPVLEALGRLGRGPEGTPLVTVLRQYAPSWLVHLPALLAPEDRERLEHTTSGVTPARMLRELAEALEVLTAARPLVLVLEDLHWSDRATLEWLAYVVRRRDPACLLLLGTYRPAELMVHAHALRAIVAELRHHPQYAELGLDALSAAATAAYLRQRCGEQSVLTGLSQLLHQRTGGNPLFLVAMVDELERQGLLERAEDASGSPGALAALRELIPRSLRQYIEQHFAQLSEADQALLEAASVAGSTFAVAAVAAGMAQAPETLEGRYTAFARQGRFIQAAGTETWPDGTVTACYQFRHALYHEVVYGRVSAGHRVRLHQQIGVRKETGYGAQAQQMAAELALHFTRGRDTGRAVTYLQHAGENALRRSAYQEAITHLTGGLEMLATFPETPERAQQELAMQTTLGPALVATKGFAAPEVWHAYTRARALCQQVGDTLQRFQVLRGLWYVALIRLELRTARELGEQLLTLAQQADDAVLRVEAHYALGLTMNYLGALAVAQTHLAQGIALYDPQQHRTHAFRYGQDAGVACRAYGALTLWWLGYPERALRQSYEAVTLARELVHPFSVGFALVFAAWLHQLRREGPRTQEWAEAAIALVAEHKFAALHAQGTIYRGWAVAAQGAQPGVGQEQGQEGLSQIQQGLAAWRATGAEGVRPYYLALQAEAAAQVGQPEAALTLLAEALAVVNDKEERRWEAELYRLKGEVLLTLSANKHAEAETCFRQALDIACGQQAKALELRAAMSLSRLWQHQDKRAVAYNLLAPVYGWFTEGFDTPDLQEAKALLETLAG